MKRFIWLILALCWLTVGSFGQGQGQSIIRANAFHRQVTTAVVWSEEEYQDVYDAMTTKPSTAIATDQNAMVKSLVDGGYWARWDVLYIFATSVNTGNEALINWLNPGTFNADNPTGTAWTSLQGYTGSKVGTDNISTNWNPSSDNTHFLLDDGSVGEYIRTNIIETAPDISADDGTNHIFLSPKYSAGTDICNAALNSDDGVTTSKITNTDGSGLYIVNRTASNAITVYHFGNTTWEDNEADVSVAIPNTELILLKLSDGAAYSENQIAIFWAGDSVDDAEAAAINTIFETYMDAIGSGVQ